MKRPSILLSLILGFFIVPVLCFSAQDPAKKEKVEKNLKDLSYGSFSEKRSAAIDLGLLGDTSAVPYLIMAFEQKDLREAVVTALGRLRDRSAVPVLLEALKDDNKLVRSSAAVALSNVGGPSAKEAVPVLIDLLENDKIWKSLAADSLGDIGPAAKEAIPYLINAMKYEEENVALSSAVALGEIGKSALPDLVKALKGSDKAVKSLVCGAIYVMGPDAKDAVSSLIEILKDDSEIVRQDSARALGHIGSENALGALTAMEKNDRDEQGRITAREAIDEIRSKKKNR